MNTKHEGVARDVVDISSANGSSDYWEMIVLDYADVMIVFVGRVTQIAGSKRGKKNVLVTRRSKEPKPVFRRKSRQLENTPSLGLSFARSSGVEGDWDVDKWV
jgi:hypothetical protein